MARTVGKCEICREWIDAERLEALPDTLLCGEHAKQIARYGGEFITQFQEEPTSKPGSLKINIGGVATKRVRNNEAIEKLRRDYEEEQYGS